MAKVVKLVRKVNQYVLLDGGQKFCNQAAYQVEGVKGDRVYFLGKFNSNNMPLAGQKIFLAVKTELVGGEADLEIATLPAGFRVIEHFSGWSLPVTNTSINDIIADINLPDGWKIYKLSATEYVFKASMIMEKEYQSFLATMYWIGNALVGADPTQSVEL